MDLTYFGHSACQFTIGGTRVLVDPFITGNRHTDGVITAEALDPHVILLTHAHGDHWGDTVAIAKRTGALVIANHEIVSYLEREHGHSNVFGMNTGGSHLFPWGRLFQTHARHSSSFPDGTYGGNPNGYILHADAHCIYMLGDTAPFAEMAWIGDEHDVDVALMPIGDCYTMGPADSIRAARMLKPALTIPVHYNTFPPIKVDVDGWADMMADSGFRARVMVPGETIRL